MMMNLKISSLIIALFGLSVPASAQGTSSGEISYACHRVEAIDHQSGNLPPSPLRLNHHFGSSQHQVEKIGYFCSAATTNEGRRPRGPYLTCYNVRTRSNSGKVEIANRFQEAILDVKEVSLWCIQAKVRP